MSPSTDVMTGPKGGHHGVAMAACRHGRMEWRLSDDLMVLSERDRGDEVKSLG